MQTLTAQTAQQTGFITTKQGSAYVKAEDIRAARYKARAIADRYSKDISIYPQSSRDFLTPKNQWLIQFIAPIEVFEAFKTALAK